jgi:hypothetical protein
MACALGSAHVRRLPVKSAPNQSVEIVCRPHEETSVSKKAGIVAVAITAGMLALSPLAFANDYGRDQDRERGDVGTASFGSWFASFGSWFDDDDCTSEQTDDGRPPILPALIPSLTSQEQSGNCVDVPDEAEPPGPTPPPTTTVPPAPVETYTRANIISVGPGTPGEDSVYCDPGDTPLEISYTDPSGVALGPAFPAQFQDRRGATIAYNNTTSGQVQLSVSVLCEDTNPGL